MGDLFFPRQNTPHWKIKKIRALNQRSLVFCPLTPTEVGNLLQALGYPESIHIYVTALKLHGIGLGPVSVGRSSPSFDTKEIFGSFSSGCRFKSGSPNF